MEDRGLRVLRVPDCRSFARMRGVHMSEATDRELISALIMRQLTPLMVALKSATDNLAPALRSRSTQRCLNS